MRTSRSFMFLLAGVLAFTMLFGAPVPEGSHAGTLDDPWVLFNTPTVAISWTPYVDTELVMAECQVAEHHNVRMPIQFTTTHTVTDRNLLNDTTQPRLPIRPYVEALDNGKYWFRVRVSDVNGNVSAWTAPLVLVKDWKAIEPPGGCALLR